MRKTGYYWVQRKGVATKEIAIWVDGFQSWYFCGNMIDFQDDDLVFIGREPIPRAGGNDMKTNNEQLYYDTLRLITRYDTVERLRKRAERDYGISFEEALEYAYGNVKGDAERAIYGRRKPRPLPGTANVKPKAHKPTPEGTA